MKRHITSLATAAALIVCGLGTSRAAVITFDDILHGEIVTNQIAGITVTAMNFTIGHPDIAIGFDTGETGTADPDLEGPAWARGNLDNLDTLELGTVLIIAENDVDDDGDFLIDDPDDEGNRAAGKIIFDLATARNSVGFDLVDVEGIEDDEEPGSFATFYLGGDVIESILFADFLDGGAYDQDAEFGNNSVNRIAPIGGFGLFDRIEITLGGSGAVDNLVLLPAPGVLGLMGLGLGVLALSRRRDR